MPITRVTTATADTGNFGNSTVMVTSVTRVTTATADTSNLGNNTVMVTSVIKVTVVTLETLVTLVIIQSW